MSTNTIQPFLIEVPEHVLTDLRDRLARTRWTVPLAGAGSSAGTDPQYLRELVMYWKDTYDWRKQEVALNAFAHFKTEIADCGLHFIHGV